MIFYTNTSRVQLIVHSLNYTHTYYLTLHTLKRKRSCLVRAIEWYCTLFNELANPGTEAIMGAVVLADWPSDPPATISLGRPSLRHSSS